MDPIRLRNQTMCCSVLLVLFGTGLAKMGLSAMEEVQDLRNNGINVVGRVVDSKQKTNRDGNTYYESMIKYTAGDSGERLFSAREKYSIGDNVMVRYLPHDVTQVRLETDRGDLRGEYAELVCAGCIIFAGVFCFLNAWLEKRRILWLFAHGKTIKGIIRAVKAEKRQQNRKTHTVYQIVAEAPDPSTGQPKEFKSDWLAHDPGQRRVGHQIKVYVDPEHADVNYVDCRNI